MLAVPAERQHFSLQGPSQETAERHVEVQSTCALNALYKGDWDKK
jgi:hypothetical protein